MRTLILVAAALALAGCASMAAEEPHEEDSEAIHEEHTDGHAREENREIQVVRERLEVMRFAVVGLVEAGKHDPAARVEQAMHARELSIAGERSEDANRIREGAPNRAELAELLRWAGNLLREQGKPERGEAVIELAEVFEEQAARRRHRREDGNPREREKLERDVELLRLAQHGLREIDKGEWAAILEHGAQARLLALEGRRDEEAVQIRETQPDLPQLIELLAAAREAWAELGHEKKAAMVRSLENRYRERWQHQKKRREREQRPELAEHLERTLHRVELLEGRVEKLHELVEHLLHQVHELREAK